MSENNFRNMNLVPWSYNCVLFEEKISSVNSLPPGFRQSKFTSWRPRGLGWAGRGRLKRERIYIHGCCCGFTGGSSGKEKVREHVISVIVKITQGPTLCQPMHYTVHGILQARVLEWVAIPFSRGSSQSRDRTQVSCIADGFFTNWAIREAQVVKNPPANARDKRDTGSIPGLGRSPGGGHGDPLQYFAWRILWTVEPGGLQSIGLHTVRYDWSDLACTHTVV